MGNDVQYYYRPVLPYKQIFCPTNAGSLIMCREAEFFKDKQEAYDFLVDYSRIPQKTLLQRLCSKTVITSLGFMVCRKLELIDGVSDRFLPYVKRQKAKKEKAPTADYYMDEIEKISRANGSKFILTITPDLNFFGFKPRHTATKIYFRAESIIARPV